MLDNNLKRKFKKITISFTLYEMSMPLSIKYSHTFVFLFLIAHIKRDSENYRIKTNLYL